MVVGGSEGGRQTLSNKERNMDRNWIKEYKSFDFPVITNPMKRITMGDKHVCVEEIMETRKAGFKECALKLHLSKIMRSKQEGSKDRRKEGKPAR